MSTAKRTKLEQETNKNTIMTLYPVLSNDLIQDTPLIDVYVDTIINLKSISTTVVELNSCLPILELTHLKRIKNREIILFPVSDIKKEKVHEILKEKNFDTSLLKNCIRVASVAKIPPQTRKQYTEVHKHWPCNFHSDKYLEKLSTNTLFSVTEISDHKRYMEIAIEVAKISKLICNTAKNIGVIIVDPKINSVVAVGYSETIDNPCKHAPMIAIDNVAKTQNGGAWKTYIPESESLNLNMAGFSSSMLSMLHKKFNSTNFGASRFKGKSVTEEPSDGPYLCTGYYVYSTHEPCVMCAMGLIHSRVKRVFYGVKSGNGGLGTLCKIHSVKDLNHHYEVFAGLLENECRLL